MSYCDPQSALRQIPIYHLEAAIIKSVPSLTREGKIDPEDDPDVVADRLVCNPQLDEFCWSLYFEAPFLVRLFRAGFLPICSNIGAPGDPLYVLLPKLHFSRSVVSLAVASKRRKRMSRYSLTVNLEFDKVIQGCLAQHGDRCWLYPPLIQGLTELNKKATRCVFSVELWNGAKLVAGEIGYTVGAIYTSMTGFYTESGSGSIQLALLHDRLRACGFELWDLGMDMEYKRVQLGAELLDRRTFVNTVRTLREKRIELT